MGKKGDKAGSKLLRGQEEEKDYPTRQALLGVARKGKGNRTGYRRLRGRQAGLKNTNGHPGRVTTRGTDPTRAPQGPGQSTAQENRSFSDRRRIGAAQALHLCARRAAPAPRRIRFVPACRLTAAVTKAPGPTRCPAHPRSPHNPARPPAPRPLEVAPHRSH